MSRVDTWETVAAVAGFAMKPRTVRGTRYALSAYTTARHLDKLARIGRTLHRLYEVACSDPIHVCNTCDAYSDADPPRRHVPPECFYARLERLEARAEKVGRELGIVVTHQRDPRGAALKLWADKEDGRMLGCFS